LNDGRLFKRKDESKWQKRAYLSLNISRFQNLWIDDKGKKNEQLNYL
jgi:hypothetical protein